MVDISGKAETQRLATARSTVSLPAAISKMFEGDEYLGPKGPVIATAIIAGTLAVKNTSNMIPFCHPLPITSCKIRCWLERNPEPDANSDLHIECTVKVSGTTGVEMEALTGASVAALTVYDMCKAVSHCMVIKETKLMLKTGGKSGEVRPFD
jgi:cyclic pyranopterin phosphate synthase